MKTYVAVEEVDVVVDPVLRSLLCDSVCHSVFMLDEEEG